MAILLGGGLPATAAGSGPGSGHCDAADHAELEARVARLEALITQLEGSSPQEGEVTIEPPRVASAPMTVEERGLEADLPANQTYHDQGRYLPSRGWNAAWLGVPERAMEIRAFIDLEYIDAGPDGSRGGVSTFDNHHTQVFLQSRIRPNLFAHAELEWEHSGDVVEVDQAFVSWAVAEGFSLDAGRFYAPFGIERYVWYSPTSALVSRPEVFRQIVPNNFYSNGLRAGGILGSKDKALFNWEVAISDGLGDNALENRRGSRQSRDSNSSRAVTGRLGVAFWPYLEVGASYHGQRYSSVGDLDLSFLGFDVSGRWQGFEVRSEYVKAELDREAGLGTLDQTGWYSQLSYTFDWDRDLLPSLTLVSRYDDVDLDGDVTGNDDRRLWSLGVNAAIYSQLRLKAEIQKADEEGPAQDDDRFLLQAVVDF